MIYWIPLLIIGCDQLTKSLVISVLEQHQGVPVCPFFNLFLTYNRGVSFSFLTSSNPYMPLILSVFAVGFCIGLWYWFRRENDRFIKLALTLIVGGALGNVIDRIRFGAVVDFLDFYIGDYHWPAFNVADSAICIGVILILLQSFLKKEKKK